MSAPSNSMVTANISSSPSWRRSVRHKRELNEFNLVSAWASDVSRASLARRRASASRRSVVSTQVPTMLTGLRGTELLVEMNAAAPAHPAHLAAGANEPEIHIQPAAARGIERLRELFAHARLLVSINSNKSIFEPCLGHGWEAQYAGKLRRVVRDP